MGQPIPFACCASSCEIKHSIKRGGVFFNPQQLFTKPIGSNPQVSYLNAAINTNLTLYQALQYLT